MRPGKAGPASGDFEAAARRLLVPLARPRSYLSALGNGRIGVFSPRNRWQKPLAEASEALLRPMLSSEWIVLAPCVPAATTSDKRRYAITQIGQAFLRRGPDSDFKAQHGEIVPLAADSPVRFNRAESPLVWLRARKTGGEPFLSDEEFEAGERLRKDFTLALLGPRITSHFSQEKIDTSVRPDYGLPTGLAALEARRRFWRALDAVGPESASLLVRIICHLEGLEELERALRMPKRSAKLVLRLALAALARHYGLLRPVSREGLARRVVGALPGEA